MKLRKNNRKELVVICLFLFAIIVIFLWIVNNIGLPIETEVRDGHIQVIDVSSYNGKVNWKKVKDKGINHAILKIGSGAKKGKKASQDSMFSRNYKSSHYASIYCGVYYYSYAVTVKQAKNEARHCISLLNKNGIKKGDLVLPVVFDCEEEAAQKTGEKNVTNMTVAFCEEVKKAGFVPMVYTNAYSFKNYFEYDRIKSYKIWVAHYTDEDQPDIPFPYQMWQYTETASIPGANTKSGHCDLNYYLVDKKGKLR